MSRPAIREREMLAPLVEWLRRRGRVRHDTLFATEMPWFGRRVDFVTMTTTRKTTAYELKLSDNRRAIEQAAYNSLSFDRSYVVTGTTPSGELVKLAKDHGVGIILIGSDTPEPAVVLDADGGSVGGSVRGRLLRAIRRYGVESASV